MWVRKYRMDTINEIFKLVYTGDTTGKWEDSFKENDYLDKVNSFDLSEIDNSIEDLSNEQLGFLFDIMDDAVNNFQSHDTIEAPIIPSILITEFNIKSKLDDADKYRDQLTNKEMKDFFRKYDINELNAFEVILRYVYNLKDAGRIEHNRSEVLRAKKNTNPSVTSPYNLSGLTRRNDDLTDQELNFLLRILSDAAFYFSIGEDLSRIYDMSEDFEYDYYHENAIRKMLEDTAADQEERLSTPVQKTIGTIA